MGLQKYRADYSDAPQPNGATCHYARWMGGPSLAKIANCPIENRPHITPRTVYVTGEPDTYFSQPAACKYRGRTVRGYITDTEDGLVFRALDGQGRAE